MQSAKTPSPALKTARKFDAFNRSQLANVLSSKVLWGAAPVGFGGARASAERFFAYRLKFIGELELFQRRIRRTPAADRPSVLANWTLVRRRILQSGRAGFDLRRDFDLRQFHTAQTPLREASTDSTNHRNQLRHIGKRRAAFTPLAPCRPSFSRPGGVADDFHAFRNLVRLLALLSGYRTTIRHRTGRVDALKVGGTARSRTLRRKIPR